MIKIKTENIPSEILFQKSGEKPTFEQSKETFLKAFKEANQNDSDREVIAEESDTEDLEDEDAENLMNLWLPNMFVFEKMPTEKNMKQLSAVNAETSENKIEHFLKHDMDVQVADTQALEALVTDAQSEPLNQKIEKVPAEESIFPENEMLKEANTDNPNIAQTENNSKDDFFIKKLADTPEIAQTAEFVQKVSDLPQSIRSIIGEYVGVKEPAGEEIAPDVLNEMKTTDIESTMELLTQMSPSDQKLAIEKNAINSEITEEISFPNVEDLELTDSNEISIDTEFVSPVGQSTQLNQSTMNIDIQEPVKVPAEQWVQEVEEMVLEQVEGNNSVDKVVTTRLQLTPEKLGEMDIELVIQNKALTAKIIVEQSETKEWLEQKVRQLSASLATQDIQVDDFQVVVSNQSHDMVQTNLQDNPFFQQKEQHSKQGQSYNQEIEEEQGPVEDKHYKNNHSNTGRLSIWV